MPHMPDGVRTHDGRPGPRRTLRFSVPAADVDAAVVSARADGQVAASITIEHDGDELVITAPAPVFVPYFGVVMRPFLTMQAQREVDLAAAAITAAVTGG